MTRTTSWLGTAIFLLLALGTVAGLVPWWITRWQHVAGGMAGGELLAAFGMAMIVLGLIGLLESFARFALVGQGTPAPVLPTQRLVVSGFCRFVRNPHRQHQGLLSASCRSRAGQRVDPRRNRIRRLSDIERSGCARRAEGRSCHRARRLR